MLGCEFTPMAFDSDESWKPKKFSEDKVTTKSVPHVETPAHNSPSAKLVPVDEESREDADGNTGVRNERTTGTFADGDEEDEERAKAVSTLMAEVSVDNATSPLAAKNNDMTEEAKPPLELTTPPTETVDFDINPTNLFLALQAKTWEIALNCIRKNPEQAAIWITRMDHGNNTNDDVADNAAPNDESKETKTKTLRWKLLPLHASMIFGAPLKLVEEILKAFPAAAQCQDDQGLLPLHLAFRLEREVEVARLLLMAFPEAVEIEDNRGRTPRRVANHAADKKKRAVYLQCLEAGTALRNRKAEREAVTKELSAKHREEMEGMRRTHAHDLKVMQLEALAKEAEMEKTIQSLEEDLSRVEETSQVLVDHVANLEAQLNSRSETERFLATKIASLNSSNEQTSKSKSEIETSFKEEISKALDDKAMLEKKVRDQETALASARAEASSKCERVDALSTRVSTMATEIGGYVEQVAKLEKSLADMKSSATKFQDIAEEKSARVEALSDRVSSMAVQLADALHDKVSDRAMLEKEMSTMTANDNRLRTTIAKLTKKLYKAGDLISELMQGQDAMVNEAETQATKAADLSETHLKLVVDLEKQKEIMNIIRDERDRVAVLVEEQRTQLEVIANLYTTIVGATTDHDRSLRRTAGQRTHAVRSAAQMKKAMEGTLSSVMSGIPEPSQFDDSSLVNEVMKTLLSTPDGRWETKIDLSMTNPSFDSAAAPGSEGKVEHQHSAAVLVPSDIKETLPVVEEEGVVVTATEINHAVSSAAEDEQIAIVGNPTDEEEVHQLAKDSELIMMATLLLPTVNEVDVDIEEEVIEESQEERDSAPSDEPVSIEPADSILALSVVSETVEDEALVSVNSLQVVIESPELERVVELESKNSRLNEIQAKIAELEAELKAATIA